MRRERLEAIKKLGAVEKSVQVSSNEFLNKQIYIVLTTKYKKEAKEAFNYVEACGYKVSKNGNGTWTITNPHTDKSVWTSEEKYSWKGNYRTFYYGIYEKTTCRLNDKIDFVNCLKIARNDDWIDICNKSYWCSVSPAVQTYQNRIRSAKRMAQSYREDIEKYQKQIAELQEKMMRASVIAAEYDAKVAAAKKELGV